MIYGPSSALYLQLNLSERYHIKFVGAELALVYTVVSKP